MHIFLDESGTFTGIGNQSPAVSVQGALVVPSHRLEKVQSRFGRLRPNLPQRKGEVKGSRLTEDQFIRVVDILAKNECLFFASIIDMAPHTTVEVEEHRTRAVDALAFNLTEGHPSELRASVARLQSRMTAFPQQLYVQSMVTIDLLHHMLDQILLYHCQRHPGELAAFHWLIDAKGSAGPTDWEDWWSSTLVVWLQALSLGEPGQLLRSGDYSHFKRFLLHELPEYLAASAPADVNFDLGAGVDLQLMFRESFRFSAQPEPGLELADVLTNGLRRALTGNLQPRAWGHLCKLLIRRRDFNIRAVTMRFGDEMTSRPYSEVLQRLRLCGRDMLTRSQRNST